MKKRIDLINSLLITILILLGIKAVLNYNKAITNTNNCYKVIQEGVTTEICEKEKK